MCDHFHRLVDVAISGCGKSWPQATEDGFTFQCIGCWKVDCLTAELVRQMYVSLTITLNLYEKVKELVFAT